MKKQPSDRAIARVLASNVHDAAGTCPDDNILAAYLDFRLGATERQRFEAHAASCGTCQEVLGLALRLEPAQSTDLNPAEERSGKRVLFRFSVSTSVAAALVAGLLMAILVPLLSRRTETPQSEPGFADVRAPQAGTENVPNRQRYAAELQLERSKPAPEAPAVHPEERRVPPGAPQPAPAAAANAAAPPEAAAGRADAAPPVPMAPAAAYVSADRAADAVAAKEPLMKASDEGPAQVRSSLAASDSAKGARRDAIGADRKDTRVSSAAVQRATPEREAGMLLKVGEKTFKRVSDSVLIDVEALEHPDAPQSELAAGSKEYAEILARLTGLEAALRPGLTVTVHWNGRNCVLRAP